MASAANTTVVSDVDTSTTVSTSLVVILTTAPPSTITTTFPSTPSTTSTTPLPSSTPIPTTIPPPAPATPSLITSVVTITNPENTSVQIVVITSTEPPVTTPIGPPTVTQSSVSTTSSSTAPVSAASTTSAIATTTVNHGLTAGGKIAVAVVVSIAAIALIIAGLLFLWRRRKQRKDEEEMRRKEVEEYGYNPNHDPTLPAVAGVASNNGDEISDMRETDGAGYRGWGNTSTTNRKASTNLSSIGGPIGIAVSDNGSGAGYHSPTGTTTTPQHSDAHSGDPLVSPINGRPTSGDSETIAALGAIPATAALGARNERDKIHRGPSNASSAYSGANRSEESGEAPLSATTSSPQYYNDAMYYDPAVPQHGPYADGSYGPAQPVIREVQARRNTRIESPSVPQQRNASIAQNF
ncbi:MAG: hypothetical protein MMC33_005381 [Icmadophila ericetorum]|nr:hypothetical protein [Icmadophila ericetorum]